MPFLGRLNNISKFNRFLRYSNWLSSPRNNVVKFNKSSLPKPRNVICNREANTSVKLRDRSSDINRNIKRVARYVNKRVMSTGEQGQSSSAGSNDETDDISLTFWIFLWAALAIIASWIYSKLNSRQKADEDNGSSVNGPEADEQIARKLVNEISKNDLVKRSTFRRQRSYEIIDGEVRIHYDVSFEESTHDNTNYSENIIDAAEVEHFPLRRTSMDEMELIFPGNLPRIIEEGEEELQDGSEVDEVVHAKVVSSETEVISDGNRESIPVINVIDDDELNSSPINFEGIDFGEVESSIKHVESRLVNEKAVIIEISQPPQAEQINVPKITKAEAKKDIATQANTQAKRSLLSNSDNSSSDELSSTSEESVIENLQNTQINSTGGDKAVAMHTSNSTTSSRSVYKMTEVAATEGDNFTVSRREITRVKTTNENCLESTQLCFTTRSTFEEPVECVENEKHLRDELKNDISCRDRRPVTNLHTDVNYDGVLTSTCGPNEEENTASVDGPGYECIAVSMEEKERNQQHGNGHEPEIVDKWHSLDRKLVNSCLDQVGRGDDCSTDITSKAELDNLDDQHEGFCNGESECDVPGKLYLTEMHELRESLEEESYTLSRLEDGSDILIDNSGDFLFKVIGPSEDEFLEDIEEVDEYVAVENEHFSLDENENCQMFKPEVEFSKSWRSLPSWEKAHHIHHRDLDRDADDSDVECSDDEGIDGYAEKGNLQVIKSEEIIRSNIQPILEEDPLESVEISKNSNEPCLVMQTSSDEFPNTSEVYIAAEMVENEAYQPASGFILTEHNGTDIESSNVAHVVADKEIFNDNLKEPEELFVKARVEEEAVHDINSTISEQDMYTEKELVDLNQPVTTEHVLKPTKAVETEDDPKPTKAIIMEEELKLAKVVEIEEEPRLIEAVAIEEDPKLIEAFQVEEANRGDMMSPGSAVNNLSHEHLFDNTTGETRNDKYSDDEVIVAYSHDNKYKQVSGVIYARKVTEEENIPPMSESYSMTSSYETKTFKETSLDSVPLISSPVTVMYLKEHDVEGRQSPFHEGTDIDSFSDVDEVDIDNIEPRENYNKSKSVTDLDQALASYGGLQHPADNNMEYEDINCTGGLSKSVPDILDSCQEESLKEAAVKSNSNTSVDSLTESLQKKKLSVSSPEITSKGGSKKVTKIKIVHVKFLEMQDGSGSDNIEEDSFIIDGDMPITGKMKRRSRNFSPDHGPVTSASPPVNASPDQSPVTTTSPPINFSPDHGPVTTTSAPINQGIVDEHFTAEKTQEKQLEFGFDDLFKDFASTPSSTQTISSVRTQRQAASPAQSNVGTHSYSVSDSSMGMPPEKGRYVARYGVIPSKSTTPQYTGHSQQGMKLSDKFQMPQEASSQHKRKPVPPSYYETQQRQKHVISRTSNTKAMSARKSCRLVTVKSGVINDYECSSDADSETSYNTPSPRMKTRKIHRAIVHSDTIDSASSSEPDSPRARIKDGRTSMSQLFGVEGDQHSQSQNVRREEKMSKSSMQDPRLFSRFGHLQQGDSEIERRNYGQQQEWDGGAMRRNMSPTNLHQAREMLSRGTNRSMEFNPFAEVEGYDGFEPFARCHSPTSISSDQSSVFSFNCDFDQMPPPTSSFHPEVYTCENPMCHKQDILLGPEKTSYKSCPACFTYYCSSQCRKLHWPAHKQSCYFGRVNTYVRSIIRLCQRRQDLSMYLSQLARDGYKKKGRGVVMATFNSPELAREFITKGHDAFSGRKPTYSSLAELNHEGIISKHRVALMQAVRDYEPNEEFVFNIAVVAVHDIPIIPAPRYKLNTVLHCIKMPLNEKIVSHQPKECDRVETRLFALPKCARHEFVNEMEARRHYCRNLSKNLRLYNIKLKEDYEDCYKKLCMYVEHDISFEPMTVYGQRSGLTYKCIISPEQNYPLNAEYC